MNNYKPTIGIEVHLELKTAAKAFSRSLNDYDSNVSKNVKIIEIVVLSIVVIILLITLLRF